MPLPTLPRAVVIGGGVAGLAAAYHLAEHDVEVTVLEAGQRVGGCVRTIPFAGRPIDVGAEGMHAATPEPLRLVEELGLGDDLVAARRTVTWIAHRDGLRPLPDGVGPAGPSRLRPLVRARLLSPLGVARAALEPLLPRHRMDGDVAVAEALSRRFGRQVVDRIVEPLLGGLHAGDIERLSLQAATPQLAALLSRHRSIVLAGRQRSGGANSGLMTVRGGLGRVVTTLADGLPSPVRTTTPVARIERAPGANLYRVITDAGEEFEAGVVVVALPAGPASQVLIGLDGEVGPLLAPLRTASVGVVLLAYPAEVTEAPALAGTGLLLPSSTARLLKSATFLTTKWPHLDTDGRVLVRASVGRVEDDRLAALDDDALTAAVVHDLAEIAGIRGEPVDDSVVRWERAMPQLEVGHRERLKRLRTVLRDNPGVSVAGAAFDGVGIAAALRSGRLAAEAALRDTTGVPA